MVVDLLGAFVPFEMTAWSSSTLFALLTAGRLIGPDRSAPRSVLMTYADRSRSRGWTGGV
ncbi:hypothetical protein ACFV4K_17660 [Nocardia sp. NPDC059764]|uniref:hypothetical protein n=1 Tax=Nocardia sp. NPDC059764 TaxID=3346939 RepID=UPI00364A532F